MTLRAKLLTLFLTLAVVPLLALGAVEYVRSLRALEALITAQNARVAERVAQTLESHAALLQSDLLLLAENAETQRWLATRQAGEADRGAEREADRFVRDAWSRTGAAYASLTYRDPQGQVIYRLGGMAETEGLAPGGGWAGGLDPVQLPIRDLRSGTALGTVALRPALAAMLPLDVLASGFGETGHGMVIDRTAGRVLYHPNRAMNGVELSSLIGAGTWQVDLAALARRSGTFRYRTADTLRVASFVSLQSPPWTVVVSGAVQEFDGPFRAVRRWSLLLFLTVALAATLAFNHLLRRTTRSLKDLTEATAVVGGGNFTPALPPAGEDEVGRLTASFEAMVSKVREMVMQIESSRQMAVLGQFAAHLSHEIRNPLTSIKLNLQKLERVRDEGRLPESAGRPLEIALREVGRLDRVVHGVLDLARARPREATTCSLHGLIEEALEVASGPADARGVRIERLFDAATDLIAVDHSQLKGALLNLLLNALEAMPGGGSLRVTTSARDGRIRLAVRDSGPGISSTVRAEVFRPFFTTKEGGTGLGLPLAKRAIEDNGGSLALTPEGMEPGTEFVIELPLSDPR